VVPCFNEEVGMRELVRRCCESAESAVGHRYELVLVDDGSLDGSWEAMTSLLAD
jgi:dolichol-phosphate mannosyltransferase